MNKKRKASQGYRRTALFFFPFEKKMAFRDSLTGKWGVVEEKINSFILSCTDKKKKKTKLTFYTIQVKSLPKNPFFCLQDNPSTTLEYNLTTIKGLTPVFHFTSDFSQKTGSRGQPRENPDPDPVSWPRSMRGSDPVFFLTPTPAGS